MICTGVSEQTALDFYLSLKDREEVGECRGPIVYLRLSSGVTNRLYQAAQEIEMGELVVNSFISLIENDLALFGSCMAHWTDICSIAYTIGDQLQRMDIQVTSEIVFRKCCSILGWDHRELDNYLVSYSAGGEDTDDFAE